MKRLLKPLCLIPAILIAFALSSNSLHAEKLTIVGTGDGTHVLRTLSKAYNHSFPEHILDIPESVGSSGGIRLVGKEKYKLGRVARKIKETEQHFGLSYTPYARIPVTFYVNPSVEMEGITIEQILNIYRGDVQEWALLGGNPGRIRVIRREQGDSSFETLNKYLTHFKDIEFTEFIKVATSEDQSVALVSSIPGAIGFGPLPDALGPLVKVLKLDGKHPEETGYPLNLVLGLIYHETNKKGLIAEFIKYVSSADAKAIIQNEGALPFKQGFSE